MARRLAAAALAAALAATALASDGNSTQPQDVRIIRAQGGKDFVCFGLALTRDVVVAPKACTGANFQVAVANDRFALKDIRNKSFTVNSQEFCAFFLADGQFLPDAAVVTDLPEDAAYDGNVVATLHRRKQSIEEEFTFVASCPSDQTDTACVTGAETNIASAPPTECVLYHAEHFYRDDEEGLVHGIWVPSTGLTVAGSCNQPPFDVFLLNKASSRLIMGKIEALIAEIEDDNGNGGGSGGGDDDDDDGGDNGGGGGSGDDDDGGNTGGDDDDDDDGGNTGDDDDDDDDDDDGGDNPGNNGNDGDQNSQQDSKNGSSTTVVIGVAAGCTALMLATGALFVLLRRKPASSDRHDKYRSASVPVAVVVSNLSEAQPVSRTSTGSEDDGDDRLVTIVKPDVQR